MFGDGSVRKDTLKGFVRSCNQCQRETLYFCERGCCGRLSRGEQYTSGFKVLNAGRRSIFFEAEWEFFFVFFFEK